MAELEETITIRLSRDQVRVIELWAKQHKVTVSFCIRFAIEQMTGVKS